MFLINFPLFMLPMMDYNGTADVGNMGGKYIKLNIDIFPAPCQTSKGFFEKWSEEFINAVAFADI